MSFTIHVGPNIRKSPYFDATLEDGVKSFSVYNHMLIPGNFGDPEGEYKRLIEGVAMWDVAVQRQVQIQGPDASKLVQYMVGRNLSNFAIGQGKYVAICDHDGTLINDPVLLKLAEDRFWFSIADSDIELWAKAIAKEKGYDVIVDEADASPLAVQGPKAVNVVADLFGDWVRDLRYFWFKETDLDGIPLVLARSGWSKQGGFELYLMDKNRAVELWHKVKAVGIAHGIGPGAPNDLERLESGLLSYGADCRTQSFPANPFEMGLGKLIDLESDYDFVGKSALSAIKQAGISRQWTGFIIEGEALSGNQHPLPLMSKGAQVGYVSELAYSHRMCKNIGVGLIHTIATEAGTTLSIELNGQSYGVLPHSLPFI